MGTHPIFESDFDCLTEMDDVLSCNIVVEKLVSDGVTSVIKYPRSELSLEIKNENYKIKIATSQLSLVFLLKTVKIHGKFLSLGKSTIEADTDSGKRRILISNASATLLKQLFMVLLKKFPEAISPKKEERKEEKSKLCTS